MATARKRSGGSKAASATTNPSALNLDELAELLAAKLFGMWPVDRGGAQERDIFTRQEHDIFARVSDIANQTRMRDAGQSEAGEADELAREFHAQVRRSTDYQAGLNMEHLLYLADRRSNANQLQANINYAAHLANLGQAQNHVADTEIGREALNAAVANLGTATVPITVEKLRDDIAELARAVLELKAAQQT